MKTKVKRLSKRTLAVFLGVLMLVSSIGLGSLITANAFSVNGGRVYLDTGWSNTYKYFIIGKDDWSTAYKMSAVSGTTGIYYRNFSGWTDANDAYCFGTDSDWGDPSDAGQKPWDRMGSHANKTSSLNGKTFSKSSMTAFNSSGTAVTANYTHYLRPRISTNGGTSYAAYDSSGAKPATLTISGTKLTTSGGSTQTYTNSSAVQATGLLARRATVNLSMTNLSDDYEFAGFGTGDTPSKTGSTSTSYSDVSSSTTYYAFFVEKTEDPSIDTFTIGGASSKTLNIGETATLASTTSNTSNSVTYSTTSDAISISGTTVKALKPVSSATITATLVDGSTYTKTVTVKVNTPQFTLSYSPSSIPATGSSTATPTVSINTSYANSSSTKSSLSYSITSGASYASINSSTGVVTSKTTAGSVTVKVTGTITYNGVSYTSAEGTATATVSTLPTVIYDCYPDGSSTSSGGTMAYDSTASATIGSGHLVYKKSITLSASADYYVRIWDGSSNYKPSSAITGDKPLSGTGVSGTKVTDNSSTKFTSGVAGTYDFYYDNDSHKFYVQGPHTVTFNTNGHGTAPSTQTIAYGGKATSPTAPTASGYTFGGWYKESGCTNAFDFSTETITANTTVYAKWTQNSHTVTYPSGTGYTVAGTKPTSAGYGDTVSFTVTPSTGYRIKSVKYTPSGGSATNATAGSNNEYHFTMPDANVTVSVEAVQTFTVTLTTNTGFDSKKYIVGTGTPNTNYSSAITVDSGSTVKFAVTYTTGYEYDSANSTLNGAVASDSNKTFTLSNITANKTVTLAAKKISWSGLSASGKYSTEGSTYSSSFSSNPVTIAATTATQLDGTTVTAPATYTEGGVKYNFVSFVASGGTVTTAATSGTNKTTTFKPTAANAYVTARYNKVYTITSSVDSSGKGAGTVSTNKTEVEAGGSYTITAAPKTNSAIESIKVNNGTATTSSPRTENSVTANQTVVVKFKSLPHLIGASGLASASWSEPGDEMTSNSDGTSFSITRENVNAGTYTFKHYVGAGTGGTYNYTAIATANQTMNGIATLSSESDGYSGTNYKLTTTVKANITLVSDGSKFTSITVVPSDATRYNITLKKVTGSTITATYNGTNYTTASGDAVISAYNGTTVTYTVTADSGKYISALGLTSGVTNTPAFSAGDTYTGTLTVSKATTVTPTVANKISVTAKTNKSARGEVSVSPANAYPGQTVTVTVTEKAGQLSTLTYTAGGTTTSLYTRSSGATSNYTFSMPPSAVTVNATFSAYSADSEYYYNGYDTSGNAKSGYHTKQMTEAMVNGQKFSYYEVSGRGSEGYDQLFTVSKGKPGTNNGYIYFTRPSNSNDWNQSNVNAYFWKDGGSAAAAWPGSAMTWQWNNEYGQGVYKVAIPSGVDRVTINDNGSHQTVDIDLTSTSGAYYWDGTKDGSGHYNVGTWDTGQTDQGYKDVGTEYFNSNTIYVNNFYTGGFNNHKVPNVNNFTKPKDGNVNSFDSCKDDYYIVVLYPNTTYTISYNGHDTTNTVGSEPMVLWMSELPIESDTIKIYAKDGSIRSETNGVTYANIADTQIVASSTSTTSIGTSASGNISGQTYETYKAEKGDTIYILTTIDNVAGKGADITTNRNKYYVRGFCVNGEVYELLSWNSSGAYRLTYKIPEDYDGSKIEITPIYYLYDTTNNPIVTFRVNGFTDALKKIGTNQPGWGNTLYAYPFYGKMGSNNNAFGAYPGQPLVYYNGQYQIQVPQKSTAWDPYFDDDKLTGANNAAKKTEIANTYVSGITMSNGYYDSVHRSIMGYGDDSSGSDHVQTYDYGDFYKIFNEKKPVDNIVFDFKYRTAKHNLKDIVTTNTTATDLESKYGTGGNGFEQLKNFHGRAVDLFGDPLSGDAADPTKTTPVYAVSIGGVTGSVGVENIAGYYATEWVIYGNTSGTTYQRINAGNKYSIPPEVLVLNDDDTTSFNTTTYHSAVDGKNITDWEALYTALETYRGKPVYISYEAADMQVGAQNYAETGSGGATRNDGRWLYSKTGESITSNIRIDVSTDNGVTYTPNDSLGTPVEGLSAYFTNAEADGEKTYSTTIDPDKEFDFEAKTTNGSYKFMGWYFDSGVKITDDNAGSTERSGSYTLVAKFMKVTSGQLILAHHVDSTGTGTGATKMAVRVEDGEGQEVRSYDLTTSDITLDSSIISSDKGSYKIYVTLRTEPAEDCTFNQTTYQQIKDTTASNGTGTYMGGSASLSSATPEEFSFTVSSLFSGTNQNYNQIVYNSKLTLATYTYNFTFKYPGRLTEYGYQTYTKSGTVTAAERKTYIESDGDARRFTEAYMNKIAPHESNFNKSYKWDISTDDRTFTKSGTNYSITKEFTIQNKTVADEGETLRTTDRTATFKLPYAYDTYGRPTNLNSMPKTTVSNKVINVNYGELIKEATPSGGATTGEERLKYYVTAPKILVDNGTNTYFQYWTVKKTGTTNEVARCYYESFNYVAYDNYDIEPVYTTSPKASNASDRTSASISFLETSRNQWNNGGNGGYTINIDAADTASDILFNDFMLGFTLDNGSAVKESAATTKVGVVVERVKKLDLQQDNTPYTDIAHYMSDTSVTTISDDNINKIKAYASSGSAQSGLALDRAEINKNSLDNKDQINYCYKLYNSIGNDAANKYSYKRYLYRAFSYINVNGTVTLSETPVYFTMWDEAAK